jgi:Icc protein
MNQPFRIVQITDCHLPADREQHYRGVNAHTMLEQMLAKVRTDSPDLLLASGDLSEDASPESYQALKESFDSIGIPVLALPGNHDDAGLLADAFPGSPVGGVEVTSHGDWQMIRLNSCVEGKPDGRISDEMLIQLKVLLEQEPQRPRLIALHHQPLLIGSPWIDKFPLLNPGGFLQLIDQCSGVKVVLWGHVHQVFDGDRRGIAMLGGPSSTINSLPGSQSFTPDPMGPACRWLDLYPDGGIKTGIMTLSF